MGDISRKSALLVGNGFSINFDSDFANIYDRLIEGHKYLLENVVHDYISDSYKIWGENNYNKILQTLKGFNQDSFDRMFNDAILFAGFIVNNAKVKEKIKNHKAFSSTSFGFTILTVIESIYKTGKNNGYKSVNIENWTVLVWVHYILFELREEEYYKLYLSGNVFIELLWSSDIINLESTKNDPNSFVTINSMFNGFIIYYKDLMAATIFNSGKSIDMEKLGKLNNLNLSKIKEFTDRFDILMTLNYDHILENVTDRKVEHLHGKFEINKEVFVNFQKQSFNNEISTINYSSIQIGDYLFYKTILSTISNLGVAKDKRNKKLIMPTNAIPTLISEKSLNHIVIFGMNAENDFHILRGIMLGFSESNTLSSKVTYCYFTEEERHSFEETWYRVITFGKEYSEYSRGIELEFVNSKEIINDHFLVKEIVKGKF